MSEEIFDIQRRNLNVFSDVSIKYYKKMTITQDQIQNTAQKLSKIPGSNEKLVGNIQDILGYMKLLEEIDTTWVVGTVSVIDNVKPLRKDIQSEKTTTPTDLLACSKQKVVGNQIILPNIMK